MKIPENTTTLKDGRMLILRSVTPEDAPAMIEYLKKTAAETHFMTRLPEEVTFTLEEEWQLLQSTQEASLNFMLAAFDGCRVVGNVAISSISPRFKTRHRASLGIAILQEYSHAGLGTVLMQQAIALARQIGYQQLELGVFADNAPALALYRKMGFTKVGRIPRAFYLGDDTYVDEITIVYTL